MTTLPRFTQGLNLIELMIALAIAAIVFLLGVPSIRVMLIQNAVIAEVNELSALLQYARAQAINERVRIRLCPTPDLTRCSLNWSLQKMVFIDIDNNGVRDPENEKLLAAKNRTTRTNFVTGPARSIVFSNSGTVNSPATLLVCHKDREAQYARAVILSLQGRVKMSRDTNNDDIYEYNSGQPLSCQ